MRADPGEIIPWGVGGRAPGSYPAVVDTRPISPRRDLVAASLSPSLTRLLALVRVDLPPAPRGPRTARLLLASVVAVAGSLAADAVLVALGTHLFPGTKGYGHFRFADYARLTVIGVVIACAAWPVVTRISSSPRWLFLRQAVAVTLVLWLPDVWILAQGQPARAVAVLMVMHVAIAVVTYNALVRLAPAVSPRGAQPASPSGGAG